MSTDAGRSGSPNKHGGIYKLARGHSCMLCQQRKVRCDRQKPCSNCTRARVKCVESQPVAPRRRQRRPAEQELVTRLQKYERVLEKHGIKVEDEPDIAADMMEVKMYQGPSKTSNVNVPGSKPGTVLYHGGSSRYAENVLWTSLADEFHSPRDEQLSTSDSDTSNIFSDHSNGLNLLFGQRSPRSLSDMHPSPVHIFRLWQACLDNVNPLVKLFHAPTLQQTILDAAGNLSKVSAETEAMMFSIYLSAIISMSKEECLAMMGESRKSLIPKYSTLAQCALVNAELLKTSSLVVLQAYTLYLLVMRQEYDSATLSILTGVAARIGRRIGLHQESVSQGCSIFEAEIRRRLWWQIIVVDYRSAQLAGAALEFEGFQPKKALNVNDSDLYPSMKEPPKDHAGATEMLFCSMRYEIGEHMRKCALSRQNLQNLEYSPSIAANIAAQDKIIDELETAFNEKYLKYCDLSLPFHQLCVILAKAAVCYRRLENHNPRQYADKGASLGQEEKDQLLRLSLEMIENDSLAYSNKAIRKYLWHVQNHFQLDAFIFILRELCYRMTGEVVEQAWQLVAIAYQNHQYMISDTRNPLYFAIGNLAVKAWETRVAELGKKHYKLEPPRFITTLLHQRRGRKALSRDGTNPTDVAAEQTEAAAPEIPQSTGGLMPLEDVNGAFEFELPADYVPMDIDPADWEYWQTLLADCDLPSFEGVADWQIA